jgi:hypothetical protein
MQKFSTKYQKLHYAPTLFTFTCIVLNLDFNKINKIDKIRGDCLLLLLLPTRLEPLFRGLGVVCIVNCLSL